MKSPTLADAEAAVRHGLLQAAGTLAAEGVRTPPVEGKLLRPLLAYALVPEPMRRHLDPGFWFGALAIQMVHEASLLHDDILDDAAVRRGFETTAAREGIGRALVLGDLYLTGAYRAAARAGRPDFLASFIEAVERTVAGEVAQGCAAGARVAPERYEESVRGKSGALFGAACALGVSVVSGTRTADAVEIGRVLGATYQRVDDLLDYCTRHDTGKPPLQDFAQRKWTWILDMVDGIDGFEHDAADVARRIFSRNGEGVSPADRALGELRARGRELVDRIRELSPGDQIAAALLDGWIDVAERAVLTEAEHYRLAARGVPADTHVAAARLQAVAPAPDTLEEVRAFAAALGGSERWPAYFGRHARTFRLASLLFPAAPRQTVSGVYAFCRFTDDLVDDPSDGAGPERVRARLQAWRHLTEAAWSGERTGVPVLDEVIGGSARSGVSRRYPMALLDGVAMDLDLVRYDDWADLEAYTFGVAGAVGGWLTQGFGLHDRDLLECAHALGHAMQLTNIARDVGEDARGGRVYLPGSLLTLHGLSADEVVSLALEDRTLPGCWPALTEALLARADIWYGRAWPGIRALPGWYRRPVAAAAAAYRGIHDEIRRNGYDNVRRRAHTSTPRKISLAASAVARTLYTPARTWSGLEEATG